MPRLFGLDIAKQVNDALASAGGVLDVTMLRVSSGQRTAGSPAAGTNPTTSSLRGKGFYDDRRLRYLEAQGRTSEGTLVRRGDRVAVLLGASFPGREPPRPGYLLEIQDEETDRVRVVEVVGRDPAAATYECLVRRT